MKENIRLCIQFLLQFGCIYPLITTFVLDFAFLFVYTKSLCTYSNWGRRKWWQDSEKEHVSKRTKFLNVDINTPGYARVLYQ